MYCMAASFVCRGCLLHCEVWRVTALRSNFIGLADMDGRDAVVLLKRRVARLSL